jgi:hypothetical protein
LYFLREKVKFTPLTILLAAIGLGIADLLISKGYDLWFSQGEIVGASLDPPYLLTIFVIMPLFLRTYLWLPDGMVDLFQSLPKNKLIRRRDLPTYQFNMRLLVERYSPAWARLTLIIAIILQLLVIVLNRFENYQAYNTIDTARLWLIRVPYGLLALYAATFVVIRSILNMDWSQLFKDIEPQINPLHPDQTGGYGMFTHYITNLLGIFMAIATFFFTKLFFQRDASSTVELRFYPSLFILGATVFYLLVGFIVFIYIPSRVARRAIGEAKTQHCEKLSEQHCIEQKKLVEMTRKTGSDPQELQAIKNQMEKVKLLRETSEMIKDFPTTPISFRAIPRLGASYILFLFAMLYNLLAYLQQNGVIQNTTLRNAIDFILQLFPK